MIMSEQIGSQSKPARIAVIGAGPAGFYAVEALLKQKDLYCVIDLFNRFPTPYGLVRDGVAPDHESMKTVTRTYDKLAEHASVRYFGNVTFGTDIQHDDLKCFYDQIVYAVGAQADRRMSIPGEELIGSYPATAFVGWYNGHPDYRDFEVDLSCERVIVVGNGNVAMDVARILVTSPDELAKTDIADHALEDLRKSKVREVVMLGRRGPAQAAFTTPELREFGKLEGVQVIVDPQELENQVIPLNDKMAERNLNVLRDFAARTDQQGERRMHFRFLVSPVEVMGEDGKVAAVRIEKNELVPDGSGGLKAKGTGVFETIMAGMVLRSVGYCCVPLPDVPFDEKALKIPNVAGRVTQGTGGEVVSGEYVVGWAKRGPSGVIGTNRQDSFATVTSMMEDLPKLQGIADENRDPQKVVDFLKENSVDFVNYEEWKRLDAHESARGAEQNRPRVKVTRITEMMEIIRRA